MARRKLLLTVEAEEMFDTETGEGFLHFTFSDTACQVGRGKGDDREDLGEVVGCMGGGIELQDNRLKYGDRSGKARFYVSAMEFWNAFQRALASAKLIDEPLLHVPEDPEKKRKRRSAMIAKMKKKKARKR